MTSKLSANIKVLLVWLAAALVFFFFYSRTLFVLLMAQYDFFSYDLFEIGTFGMSVFFLTVELMMMVGAISTFGVIIPLIQKRFRGRFEKSTFYFLLILNGITLLLVVVPALYRGTDWIQLLLLLVLLLAIACHLAITLHAPREKAIRSALLLMLALLGMTFVSRVFVVGLLEQGLRAYGIGGRLPAMVYLVDGEVESGQLVLMSPDNIYLKMDGTSGMSTYPRKNVRRISISSSNPTRGAAEAARRE